MVYDYFSDRLDELKEIIMVNTKTLEHYRHHKLLLTTTLKDCVFSIHHTSIMKSS